MVRNRRIKSRTQAVPVPADSSCPSGGADGNPNLESSFQWETSTEEQLEKIIRMKLYNLYFRAMSILVPMVFDEDIAFKALLARGYCIGKTDSLSSVVGNSRDFLTGKEVYSEEEDQPPQPFQNLGLLVEFNLQFMVYILQKYRPNLNRISACRCILLNNLDLNLSIVMDVNDTTEMLSNLNLDDGYDDDDKDRFLALEIREMLNNLNVVDDSISEDMKDMIIANSQKKIDDLEVQLKERMRWASKKVAQGRLYQPRLRMDLAEEIGIIKKYTEMMLHKKESVLSSMKNEFDNAARTANCLKMVQKEINEHISASLSILSETEKKGLLLTKHYKMKLMVRSCRKQRLKLLEVVEMEEQKISKWRQQLDDNNPVINQTMLKLRQIAHTREKAIAHFDKAKHLALVRWDYFKRIVEALEKNRGNAEEFDYLKDDMLMVDKLLETQA